MMIDSDRDEESSGAVRVAMASPGAAAARPGPRRFVPGVNLGLQVRVSKIWEGF